MIGNLMTTLLGSHIRAAQQAAPHLLWRAPLWHWLQLLPSLPTSGLSSCANNRVLGQPTFSQAESTSFLGAEGALHCPPLPPKGLRIQIMGPSPCQAFPYMLPNPQ